MKNFLSENSKAIVKFILTHIVMSLLGIMVGLAVLVIEGEDVSGISGIALFSGAFTVGFMCFMHYDDMYFIAEKEGIRCRAEGLAIDKYKGIKITLVAYAPVIIVGLVAIAFSFTSADDVKAIPQLIYYAFQGSFIPLYSLRVYIGFAGYVLVSFIPAIVSSFLGYYMGQQDKTLRGIMGMKVKAPYDGPLERERKNKRNK